MNKTLSALIMVHNEEAILESCLKKLIFCDEIVVILDKSTDKSKKITQNFSKKIFEGSWEYEGDRRNFGIKKCTSDWIIEVDADEHISKKLADEIMKTINLEDKYSNYHIKIHTDKPRSIYFNNQIINNEHNIHIFNNSLEGWYFESKRNILHIKIRPQKSKNSFSINIHNSPKIK